MTTLPPHFWAWAETHPDRPAILDDTEPFTFGELAAAAHRTARAFQAAGLEPGDVVALLLDNSPTAIQILLAVQESGVRSVSISGHLVADEIAYLLADAGPAAVITTPERAPQLRSAMEQSGAAPALRWSIGTVEGFVPLAEAVAGEPPLPPEVRLLGGPTFYTSGTTGRSKAVVRAGSGDPVAPETAGPGALAYLSMFEIEPGDEVQLVVCPLYHAAPQGWSMFGLHLGHALVVPRKWSAEGALALIERHRVTYAFMVPTQFKRLLQVPDEIRRHADVSSLRKIVHAAAPCPVEVKRAMLDWWGPIVWEFYAGTEGGGTLARPEDWSAKPGTVGRAWPNSDVRILDDDGVEVPGGHEGQIWMKAAAGARFEYKGDPEKSDRSQREGYFTIGDIGYLDPDGYLFLLDRRTDLIITGGVNVYPAEIEGALLACPQVSDVAVFGVPDPEWGHAVMAVVQPAAGVPGDDDLRAELMTLAREKLAKIKWPRRIEFRAELPRQDNGKLYKRLLRAEFETPA